MCRMVSFVKVSMVSFVKVSMVSFAKVSVVSFVKVSKVSFVKVCMVSFVKVCTLSFVKVCMVIFVKVCTVSFVKVCLVFHLLRSRDSCDAFAQLYNCTNTHSSVELPTAVRWKQDAAALRHCAFECQKMVAVFGDTAYTHTLHNINIYIYI